MTHSASLSQSPDPRVGRLILSVWFAETARHGFVRSHDAVTLLRAVRGQFPGEVIRPGDVAPVLEQLLAAGALVERRAVGSERFNRVLSPGFSSMPDGCWHWDDLCSALRDAAAREPHQLPLI